MDIKINNNINLDNKIEEIRKLYNIINKIDNDKKKFLLKYRFQTELDFMIDKLEDYYYRYILKNKSEKKIQNETEKMIYTSRKTMETFMPYILLYNINEQFNNQENE